MGKITVVFGTGVASAQIIAYNGSTGRYEAQTYYATVTFTNRDTSKYIRVWTVGVASGYKDGSSSNWNQVYFNSGNQYIYLSATKDVVTPTYRLQFSIGAGVKRVYYNYYSGTTLEYSSSFAEGESRDWTFSEYGENGRRRVELWVETADLYPGYGTPIHNVGTYYWNANVSRVISATQSAQTYTITYNAHGGSGAPAQQTTTGAGYVTVSSTRPTRSGYSFVGWSEDQYATTGDVLAGGSYYVSSSITLYAVWRKNITLYYNSNGGSGAPQSTTGYADADGYKTFTITSSVPTRDGYTFNGWWLPTDESPRWGGSTLRISSDATLTAAWIATTYNVYGYPSTGVSSFTIQYTAANGNTVTRSFTSGGSSIPVLAGSTIRFVGCTLTDSNYYTNPIAKFCTDIDYPDNTLVAQYNASLAFTSHAINFSQNIQVKASIIQVTLSFNANGGTGEPDPITQNINTSFHIPAKVPKRDGYIFSYWYTQDDTRYLPDSNIDIYANTILYAYWQRPTYYLYFDANTSDNVSPMPTTISRVGTGNVTIPNIVPLRDNYQFTGWASGGVTYQPTDIFNLTANTTLYAQWQRTYTYTITYKSNEGIFSTYAGRPEQTSYPDTHTGTSSSFLIRILSSSDLNPARNGYTFSGWNDTASGTGQSFIGGNSYSFSGNYTLYAQWTPRSYNITINPNGGYIGGSVSPITVSKNYGETFSFSPYLPTRQYYDFEGWLSSGGVNKGGNDSYVVSGNETWTAQWSDIHSYKLTLYANYSGAPHVSSEITRTGGTQISLAEYSDNFVRDGYKLMGWDHDPNATPGTVDYAVDGTVTLSTNISLYAIWIKTYTVSYYSQGRLFATDYGDFIATIDNPGSGSGYLPNAYADVIDLIPTWADHNFKGWANSSSATVPDYTSGQAHAIPVSGNVTLYAVWQWQPLDPFYWTGTYSGDLALFQTGLPVSDAITAAGWNNLIAKIDALIQRAGLSVSTAKPSYATSGMSIMASLYNAMRGYIVAVLLQMNIGTAYFPPTVSTGDEITPYHFAFEGTNSLQGAVNHAISVFNNSLN